MPDDFVPDWTGCFTPHLPKVSYQLILHIVKLNAGALRWRCGHP
jgi:hypothetical protein